MIYISTDYVFEGSNAPYKHTDEPGPVNAYGILKLDGEKVVLKVNPGKSLIDHGDEQFLAICYSPDEE